MKCLHEILGCVMCWIGEISKYMLWQQRIQELHSWLICWINQQMINDAHISLHALHMFLSTWHCNLVEKCLQPQLSRELDFRTMNVLHSTSHSTTCKATSHKTWHQCAASGFQYSLAVNDNCTIGFLKNVVVFLFMFCIFFGFALASNDLQSFTFWWPS